MDISMAIELELDRITMQSVASYDDVSNIVINILRNVQNYGDLILLNQASKFLNKEEQ